MEMVEKKGDIYKLANNIISGEFPELKNSKIVFNGINNILFCEKDVVLAESLIVFGANNSLIYLSSSRYEYKLDVHIFNNSALYMGKNNHINGKLNMVISEEKNIVIGSGGLFSFDIWMRVADAHGIYNCHDKKRINQSQSIYIGDHVWVGQSALFLKGSKMGSGSIIEGNALISEKTIPSNSYWGGNPAKELSKDVFFDNAYVHEWTSEITNENQELNSVEYIYEEDLEKPLKFDEIEEELCNLKNNKEKMAFLTNKISNNTNKNRFFVNNML